MKDREEEYTPEEEEAASAIGHAVLFGVPSSPPAPVLRAALKRLAERVKRGRPPAA